MEPVAPLAPRIEPSSSGDDGPTSMVIAGGDTAPKPITDFFKPSIAIEPETSTRRRTRKQRDERSKGKELATSSDEEEENKPVPVARSCFIRDLSKVQRYARECPPPDIFGTPKPVGLCNLERDARRWVAPSSRLAASTGGQTLRHSKPAGPRPGRWVEDKPLQSSSVEMATQLPQVRREGRQVHHEYPSIRAGDSDQYGEVPFYIDDQPEEEVEAGTFPFLGINDPEREQHLEDIHQAVQNLARRKAEKPKPQPMKMIFEYVPF